MIKGETMSLNSKADIMITNKMIEQFDDTIKELREVEVLLSRSIENIIDTLKDKALIKSINLKNFAEDTNELLKEARLIGTVLRRESLIAINRHLELKIEIKLHQIPDKELPIIQKQSETMLNEYLKLYEEYMRIYHEIAEEIPSLELIEEIGFS